MSYINTNCDTGVHLLILAAITDGQIVTVPMQLQVTVLLTSLS